MPKSFPLIGISTGKRQASDSPLPFLGAAVTYSEAVSIAGGTPVLIPYTPAEQPLHALFERLDGIILSGGGDIDPAVYHAEPHPQTGGIDPGRDRAEFLLARWAVDEDKPLLAICRGIQVLNVALGGTLIQDIPSEALDALEHAQKPPDFARIMHTVSVTRGTALFRALNATDEELPVNSLHHQAVGQAAAPLCVAARAPDGIIEGVEIPERRFVIGVQWHPEALFKMHTPMRHLFQALVQATRDT